MLLTPQEAHTSYLGQVPELTWPGNRECHPEFAVSEVELMGKTTPQN